MNMATHPSHRVVVTGVGAVSALGLNTTNFWRGLAAGRSAIGPLIGAETGGKTRAETSVGDRRRSSHVAAQVAAFDPSSHFDARRLALLDPFAQFALVAAREAVGQSGLDFASGLGARSAVVLGTGFGGDTTINKAAVSLYAGNANGDGTVHPLTIPRAMSNAAVSHIAMEHGLMGPAFTISSACASATHAIGQAFHMVRHGLADVAVTGGSEACLTKGTVKAWRAMRVTAPDTCRPFSRDRQGLVLGEGAGVLVLEQLRSARRRGADILAEMLGFGMSSDACDIVHPSTQGTAKAIERALSDAALNPEDIDYVNAHGTGTKANDATETRALRDVFGAQADRLSVSSTKSMHGHAMGASGALEAIATVLAIRHAVVPPTANYRQADPECDLDCTPNEARDRPIGAALSNSFAFGGLNAVLAIGRAP